MPKDQEFIKRLLSIFKVEAAEHISSISSALYGLEKNLSDQAKSEIIEVVYRSAHSLKGASRSVNLTDMETLCQSMEDLLSLLHRGELTFTDDIKNLLIDSNDLLAEMVSSDENGLSSGHELILQKVKENLKKAAGGQVYTRVVNKNNGTDGIHNHGTVKENSGDIKAAVTDFPEIEKHAQKQTVNKNTAASETIRVSAVKLESLLMKAEELVTVKLLSRHYSSEVEEIQNMLVHWSRVWLDAFNSFKNSTELNYTGYAGLPEKNNAAIKELLNFNSSLKADFENKLYNLRKKINDDSRSTGGLVDDLLIEMKNILLMPFSYIFEIFPKLVRDISREQEKDIELILEGGDVEVDKRVLQEMKDPLVHLIRNSIDHGIETPGLRIKKGKPEKGIIRISVSHIDAGRVEIVISDDGDGIDPHEVRSAAMRQGMLSETKNKNLTDDEAVNLIFESGVSTSPIVTRVSGRGLGMAIVKERTDKLGGSVHINSIPGKGASFHIILPVTIATFRGILFECGGSEFVVPTKNVEKMTRIHLSSISTVENRETVIYQGHVVSLASLENILGLKPSARSGNGDFINVMIIPSGGKYIAFTIGNVLNEGEMLLKNLGKQLVRVRNISGATVLASGNVVPIINVGDIIKSASLQSAPVITLAGHEPGPDSDKKKILVVEDSITARSLYVNILEAAGYSVSSAVDGIDGFTKLINGDFDLVVTDVQMPKMNGFELTSRIRGDARYADMPVVLVTGLESTDDKKRGIDAGANAYIVKSSFDQNNLIEVIERFI